MPVRWQVLGLDIGLVSDLNVRLELMPDLGVRLGCGRGFSVAGC